MILKIFLKDNINDNKKSIIQYFYRIYPTSVTVPYRTATQCNAPHRTALPHYRIILYVTVFKKNTIVTLFVTFTVTFYPVTRTVTSIVTLNCNGKYTVTPTVTVIIVKNKALRAPLQASLQFW